MNKYHVKIVSKALSIPGATVEIRLPLITTSLTAAKAFIGENLMPLDGTYDVTIVLDGKVDVETMRKF